MTSSGWPVPGDQFLVECYGLRQIDALAARYPDLEQDTTGSIQRNADFMVVCFDIVLLSYRQKSIFAAPSGPVSNKGHHHRQSKEEA